MVYVVVMIVIDVSVYKFFFFFFKQKTAYEMRISYCSSDVCSSDLKTLDFSADPYIPVYRFDMKTDGYHEAITSVDATHVVMAKRSTGRSEEHTSELQSLMRISYAVFCLKKKKRKHEMTSNHNRKKKIHKHRKLTNHQNINKSKSITPT